MEPDRVEVFFAAAPVPLGLIVRSEEADHTSAQVLLNILIEERFVARGEAVKGIGKNLVVLQVGMKP